MNITPVMLNKVFSAQPSILIANPNSMRNIKIKPKVKTELVKLCKNLLPKGHFYAALSEEGSSSIAKKIWKKTRRTVSFEPTKDDCIFYDSRYYPYIMFQINLKHGNNGEIAIIISDKRKPKQDSFHEYW